MIMKQVLVFGAGKSTSVLIEYLLNQSIEENWFVTVADANLELAQTKTGNHERGNAVSIDINNATERRNEISKADIVLSMLPPQLHILVAKDCIHFKKHLLTASYVDDEVKMLAPELEKQDILFLYEMGLDPGIDHMSAMKIINEIQSEGGIIKSFKSHCGGLVAPESDDNPWHYKISWNPRNVVMAGKAGAVFLQDGVIKNQQYEELFENINLAEVPESGTFAYYPNRDSLSYIPLYGLDHVDTFIRTTLRHPDFMYGWKHLIDLKLTDETIAYETGNKSLASFFKEHFEKNGFNEWLKDIMTNRFAQTKELLENLLRLTEAEKMAAEKGNDMPGSVMLVDKEGGLDQIELETVKHNAAATIANNLHEANLVLKQLFFIGIDDQETIIKKERCSPADVLQLALETKLALQPGDKDMIIMLHEIEFEKNGEIFLTTSSLEVKGLDHIHTAMAKTVGLPLGISVKMILNGTINLTGLHVPLSKEIYEPVLKELAVHGIKFREQTIKRI